MRRGFDLPTLSSASRTSAYDQAQQPPSRTRQGRNDAPAPADPTSARRKWTNQPSLTLPQQPTTLQPSSSPRKSPAYLEGKNPYGQILDDVDHPYRQPRTTGGAPSQLSVNTASESRTPGFSEANPQLKHRPEPEPKVTTPDPLPLSFVRQLAKPVSVQAAKDFFESKAAQSRSAPSLPPAQAAVIAKGAVARKQVNRPQPPTSPLYQPKYEATQPVPTTESMSRIKGEPKPDEKSILTRQPSEASTQLDSSRRVNRISRPRTDSPTRANVRGAVKPQDSPMYEDDPLAPGDSEANTGQRQSNIILETAPRDTNAEGEAVNNGSEIDNLPNAPMIAASYAGGLDPLPNSNKSVREHPAYKPNSEAETHESADERPPSYSQAQRPKLSRAVRETVEDHTTPGKRVRRRESRSASLRKEETLAERRARYEPRKSPAIGLG
jgi:hypothetical protein